jgi:aldose 1-epimerase
MPFESKKVLDEQLWSEVIQLYYANPDNPEENLEVRISPEFGSNLYCFKKGENNIIFCDYELLKNRDWTGCFVLWPLPNRVRNKQYEFENRTVSVEGIVRKRGNWPLIHGVVDDQVWNAGELAITDEEAVASSWIEITSTSPLYKYFPYESALRLTYLLTKTGLTIQYVVTNKSKVNVPFGFALHPYFNLLSGKSETKVILPADKVMEMDEQLLPTGKLINVSNTAFDLRAPTAVKDLHLDHVFTALSPLVPVYIDYTRQKIKLYLESSPEFTHMVLYTLENNFICFENQTGATDMINLHTRAEKENDEELKKATNLLIVPPGKFHTGYIHYRIETY